MDTLDPKSNPVNPSYRSVIIDKQNIKQVTPIF